MKEKNAAEGYETGGRWTNKEEWVERRVGNRLRENVSRKKKNREWEEEENGKGKRR